MVKSEWDDMKTTGFKLFLYRIFLGLSYPLRHPFVTIVVLLAFFRHELADVWNNYQHKISAPVQQVSELKNNTTAKLTQKLDDMRTALGEIVPNSASKQPKEQKKDEEVRFVSWNVAKFSRAKPQALIKAENFATEQTFSEAEQQAKIIRSQEIEDDEKSLEEQYRETYYAGKLEDYYLKKDSLNLEYLSEPEKLYGTVSVAGPNSLFIDDKFVFLYGIYSNPKVYDAAEAQAYLTKVTENRKVHCDIVAYATQNQSATALCFVHDIFINKVLVDKKLAANIALK